MAVPVGSALTFRLTCKHHESGVETLFDPTVVQFSFIKPDGSEDALTYGGGDANDANITRISAGLYEVFYNTDAAGAWKVRAAWSHTSGGVTVESKSREYTVTVESDQHAFADS